MRELNLTEIQERAFGVLLEIEKICAQEHIPFFLIYGTALGAVRHKDFIPWDDDLDIGMMRPDYERFVQYCISHKESLAPFELFHPRTCEKYVYPIARFSDSRYHLDVDNMKDYGLGIFVDIYPVDAWNADDKKTGDRILRCARNISRAGLKNLVVGKKKALKVLAYPIVKTFNINKLCRKHDELAKKYAGTHQSYATVWWCNPEKLLFPISVFEDGVFETEFHGKKFNILKRYDDFLKAVYGDYMKLPPEEKRIPQHDYVAYEK